MVAYPGTCVSRYTENYMADLAFTSMGIWNELEGDAGESLRDMHGLLNFGDPDYKDGPEGVSRYPGWQ